jgi:plasmid rolling circle replication initiator protein Rep
MDDTKTLNPAVQDTWPVSELLKDIPRLMKIYLKATLKTPVNTLLTHSCELLEGR